jgi:DNA repair ATPase RecN
MCSITPTKVGIDNSSAPESPTPRGLSLSSATNLSHEQSGTVPALVNMVEALKSEIEEAMAEMQAIWDEMAVENGNLPTIEEEI